jgi:hypothetical protein
VDGEEESAYLLSDRVNQPPRQLDDLALYSDASKLPKLTDGAVIAVVDSSYKVLAQFKAANFNPAVLQLPPGSNLIVGFSSAAGLFVEEKLKPNVVVEMLVRPAFVPMGKRTDRQIPLMMNPLYPAVRHRLRNLLIEVAHNYDVDGILFDDRLRFASINADMSDTTRVEFEKWMQKSVDWPRDIFRWEVAWPTLQRRVIPGPLYETGLLRPSKRSRLSVHQCKLEPMLARGTRTTQKLVVTGLRMTSKSDCAFIRIPSAVQAGQTWSI